MIPSSFSFLAFSMCSLLFICRGPIRIPTALQLCAVSLLVHNSLLPYTLKRSGHGNVYDRTDLEMHTLLDVDLHRAVTSLPITTETGLYFLLVL